MKFDELGQGGQDGENMGRDQDQLSFRSKKILSKMDTDNDGIVTYNDAARYGKEKKKQLKQWKCLFLASVIILFITYGVVFGLFLLGFELTKTIDIDNNNGQNSLVSADNGEKISTLQDLISYDLSSIWDRDNNTNISYVNIDIDTISGLFGNRYYNIDIAYSYLDLDTGIITFHDFTGKIKIEYIYNFTNFTDGKLRLYHDLPNECNTS